MIRIKAFNVVITLAAFAALFFLLPADNEGTGVMKQSVQNFTSQPSVTQKANQRQPIRGNFLHSA